VHINRVDLNLLVVLDAIYTERSITRAAAKLHLTQPAVSHSLGRLRLLFKDELFAREGRAMVPTPLARNLIEPVRRALRGLEVTLNELERFDPASTQKRFTVAVRDVFEAPLLPPLLRAIHRSAPAVDLHAVQVERRALESELANGTLDAALDVLLPLSDQVKRRRIRLDQMVVVVRKGHPAVRAARGRGMSLAAYLKQDHVLVSSRRSGPGLEDVELSRQGLSRRIRLRCQHYFAACRTVSQTDLVLTMPGHYARIANQPFGNRILPLPFEMPALDAYLYWHVNVDREPANRWLRDKLVAAFAEK
jgi:DNA-binding transcriptional LysR family regulator